MSKLLRRVVIMREKDYQEKFLYRAEQLYDRVEWRPLSVEELEKQNIMAILKYPDQDPPWRLKDLQVMLWYQKQLCYNPRYPDWRLKQQGDELMICPDRSNARPSRLGLVIVEKDL